MPVETPATPLADEPAAADDDPPSGDRQRWRPGRFVLGGAVVAMVAMWGYVLYLAFGPGRQPPIDRLDDPAFAEAAESRCAMAVSAVEDLPFASELPSASERAQVLQQANGIFAAMLDDLDDLADLAPAGEQRRAVDEWLADWRILMSDRVAYAEALQEDPDARLLVSEKDDTGRHITGWIDEFALSNRMRSCATPTDV